MERKKLMHRHSFYRIACTLLFATAMAAAVGQTAQTNKPAPPPKPAAAAQHSSAAHEDDGARVFKQNCSRCHTAPDGFSPRISATVARHMRVRASLSQKDEQALLNFLNP
jgi:cytochrome c5